jgi:hypothetical protein
MILASLKINRMTVKIKIFINGMNQIKGLIAIRLIPKVIKDLKMMKKLFKKIVSITMVKMKRISTTRTEVPKKI